MIQGFRKLGNLILAGRIVYKRITRFAAGPNGGPGPFYKKDEHLEEPGAVWFRKNGKTG